MSDCGDAAIARDTITAWLTESDEEARASAAHWEKV